MTYSFLNKKCPHSPHATESQCSTLTRWLLRVHMNAFCVAQVVFAPRRDLRFEELWAQNLLRRRKSHNLFITLLKRSLHYSFEKKPSLLYVHVNRNRFAFPRFCASPTTLRLAESNHVNVALHILHFQRNQAWGAPLSTANLAGPGQVRLGAKLSPQG